MSQTTPWIDVFAQRLVTETDNSFVLQTVIHGIIFLNTDIKVFYVTATSFPDGIQGAFDKLHSLIRTPAGKKVLWYFLSAKIKNIFIKRRLKKIPGEGEELGCETFIIKKGQYISGI